MKASRGFTLIEVMIALAIFAVAMSALMSAMNTNTRNLTNLQNRTLGHWLASNHMVGILLTRKIPRERETIEKVNFGGTDKPREWIVRIQLEDTMNKDFKRLVVSAGEEINKEKLFYASVDTIVSVAR